MFILQTRMNNRWNACSPTWQLSQKNLISLNLHFLKLRSILTASLLEVIRHNYEFLKLFGTVAQKNTTWLLSRCMHHFPLWKMVKIFPKWKYSSVTVSLKTAMSVLNCCIYLVMLMIFFHLKKSTFFIAIRIFVWSHFRLVFPSQIFGT